MMSRLALIACSDSALSSTWAPWRATATMSSKERAPMPMVTLRGVVTVVMLLITARLRLREAWFPSYAVWDTRQSADRVDEGRLVVLRGVQKEQLHAPHREERP